MIFRTPLVVALALALTAGAASALNIDVGRFQAATGLKIQTNRDGYKLAEEATVQARVTDPKVLEEMSGMSLPDDATGLLLYSGNMRFKFYYPNREQPLMIPEFKVTSNILK